MQFLVLDEDSSFKLDNRIKKEFEIVRCNSSFYNEYSNSFFIEMDANKYAINYIDYFLEGFIPSCCYEEVKDEVVDTFYNLINDREDISSLIDREYYNIHKKRIS